jgi:glycosyltransferase involved in cell wall biosynthesis
MKKVAIIHYTYPPVIGGVEFVIEAHARLLAAAGHKVKIIAGQGGTNIKNVRLHLINNFTAQDKAVARVQKELSRGEVSRNFYRLKKSLKDKIKKIIKDVDICFIHNVLTMHFNLALTAALCEIISEWGGKKVFYAWCHDASLNNGAYFLPYAEFYPWNLLGECQKKLKYIVISKQRQGEFSSLFGIKNSFLQVVHDGIVLKSFLRLGDMVWDLADKLNLFKQDIVMFFPSRLLKRKNYELAIRIVRALKEKEKKCKLLLSAPVDPHNIKTAKYLTELKSLIRDLRLQKEIVFIHELGKFKISYKDLQDFYSISDILLFSSSQEGFGLPLLEAGAKRIPIVCSDIGPFKEIGGADVILFRLNEKPEKIADRIITFLNHHNPYKMFKKICHKYLWKNIYANHLKELVMRKRRKDNSPKSKR